MCFYHHHLLRIFFLIVYLLFLQKSGVYIYAWVFDSIQFTNMSVLMRIPCSFYYCLSVVQFEIRDHDIFIFLLFRIVLDIMGFLVLHIILNHIFSRYVKKSVGISMGVKLNL